LPKVQKGYCVDLTLVYGLFMGSGNPAAPAGTKQMASKKQTAKTTHRVRNRATGEAVSFHASYRSAMVEAGRLGYNLSQPMTYDTLQSDGRWWNAGDGYTA